MIKINSVLGSIFESTKFDRTNFEKLVISRIDLEKRILRKKTDLGTDIGINLDSGIKLQHGDIIGNNETKIVVEQIPEKVISVKLKENNQNIAILLGHIIGNRHRPIAIKDKMILFPIQENSELEIFQRLFIEIIDHIELKIEEQIFLPHTSADVHEH
ncbi:MAG: Urease accessory protein UreE [Nitrosopumilus sp.]|nr:Urease accessory protein UreE [Candidatus Nitrosopumilus limneticus]